MTEQVTPPTELVEQLRVNALHTSAGRVDYERQIARLAYCAGADMELAVCGEWIRASLKGQLRPADRIADDLRAARRPKPPSLKEQALAVLDDASDRLDAAHENAIRRALEALPDD